MSSKVVPLGLNQVGRDVLRPEGRRRGGQEERKGGGEEGRKGGGEEGRRRRREEERVGERAIRWENGREERQGVPHFPRNMGTREE